MRTDTVEIMNRSAPLDVTVVIPCLNEAGALPAVLAALPEGFHALVVDNGSEDDTAQVAGAHGARVLSQPERGYGAAVQAGIHAATTEVIAVLDGDGSMDPADLPRLAALLNSGVDLVVGRRRGGRGWPLHARIGNGIIAFRLRQRYGLPLHDIGPMRIARRASYLSLGPLHQRFGYPLELLIAAARHDWTVVERDITYRPRSHGKSKVSGSVLGTVRVVADFWAVSR